MVSKVHQLRTLTTAERNKIRAQNRQIKTLGERDLSLAEKINLLQGEIKKKKQKFNKAKKLLETANPTELSSASAAITSQIRKLRNTTKKQANYIIKLQEELQHHKEKERLLNKHISRLKIKLKRLKQNIKSALLIE